MVVGIYITAGVSLLAGLAFLDVSLGLWRDGRRQGASHVGLVVLWACLGLQAILTGLRLMVAAQGASELTFLTLFAVENIMATAALWGILVAVMHPRWGRRAWLPVGVGVGALAGFYTYRLATLTFLEVQLHRWNVEPVFLNGADATERAVLAIGYYTILLVGAGLYVRQHMQMGRHARLRAWGIGAALLLTSVVGFINIALGLDTAWGPVISAFHIVAAALVLVAYYPPLWLRQRLHLPG